MRLRNLLVAAAAMLPGMAVAQTAPAETDSISRAMATVIGSYLQQSLDHQYPGDGVAHQMFVEGVAKAFSIDGPDMLYYQGLSEGLRMRDHVASLRAEGFSIDNDTFVKALAEAAQGRNTGFTEAEADAYLNSIAARAKAADEAEQQAFIDANKAREGVIATPSGLLFEVITEGEGANPSLTDTVEVEYTGRLANGKVFDSSNGQTVKFPVNRLIPGFTEGLLMMKPGGTYRLIIPSNIGYGERGAGNDIPGGAALDFTVTLHEIVK